MFEHLVEWVNLLLRWFHVIAGIMWIGSSIFFNWLDSSLEKPGSPEEGLEGELWMVHSGGFYEVKKRHLQPSQLPPVLHWFKYEALFTWISGILLLGVVYYLGGGALLIDSTVRDVSVGAALGISSAAFLGSWFLYDALWQSPLGQKPSLAAVVSFAYVVLVAWGFSALYSSRAAYLHVGALLGTLMVANVWMRILPAQTALLAATRSGQKQDPALGLRAKMRSKHNNYMTFPVIFIMISSHYPSTYGHPRSWAVLAGIMLVAGLVKHFMNLERTWRPWMEASMATAFLGAMALYFVTLPAGPAAAEVVAGGPPVAWAEVAPIVANRCLACHAEHPTNASFPIAPNGVKFDAPGEVHRYAERIKFRAVTTATMPLANLTGMTDAERALVGRWVDQGAVVE